MEDDEYHDITRRLVAMMTNQDRINDRLATSIEQHSAHLERIDTAIAGIYITLTRVETLLSRMISHGENGTDA